MASEPAEELKQQVRDYWNQQSCDTHVSGSAKFSRDYFEEIERFRYFDQPFIHSFAQFTRYRGLKVLEVGFGAGTDFIQWLRSGARASGVDLTPEALANLEHRIEVYNLPRPESIQVADAETLPFGSDSFDLGYSFGVLHHTPNTARAVEELVRVVRRGGEIKIMLYNRRSIYALSTWVKHALLKGRPWKSFEWALAHYMESPGTKAYTRRELKAMLGKLGLEHIRIHSELTAADFLSASNYPPLNWVFRGLISLAGTSVPWRPGHYAARINEAPEPTLPKEIPETPREGVLFTGNRFGFFHCISARKA